MAESGAGPKRDEAAAPAPPPRRGAPIVLLLVTIALSVGHVVLKGRSDESILDESFSNRRIGEGRRLVDVAHAPVAPARAYDLTFRLPEGLRAEPGADARLTVQLAGAGRARLVIVRPFGGDASRRAAVADVFRGRAALRFVSDRAWLDLGPLPPGREAVHVQIVGLLPGPFGFWELLEADTAATGGALFARPADGRPAPSALAPLRYRVVTEAPASPKETLARVLFFASANGLVLGALVASLLLLAAGGLLLPSRPGAGAVVLACGAILLHAALLPPLQGADESSHAATVEATLFREAVPRMYDPYPLSLSRVAAILEQERVQFRSDEPLPVAGREARERLAAYLARPLSEEAARTGPNAPAAAVQPADQRAALFYRAYAPLGPWLRGRSVLTRLAAYRLLSTGAALALFAAGAFLLSLSTLPKESVLVYASVGLLPYSVGTVAACSNYAPAIGLGSLLAAAAVTASAPPTRFVRFAAGSAAVVGSFLGILLWTDFLFVAAAALFVALSLALARASRVVPFLRARPDAALALAAVALFACFAAAAAPHVTTLLEAQPLPTAFPLRIPRHRPDAETLPIMVAAVLVPSALALAVALALRALAGRPEERVSRSLRAASGGLLTALVLGFLAVPFTTVPYENVRLGFADLVRAHVAAFLSNNFAFDQDTLTWKLYWGDFGWHDAPYPDWTYAVARWAAVLLLFGWPALSRRFVARDARLSAWLVVLAGLATSCAVATEILRYLHPGNPWGRFILPVAPLILLPLLVPPAGGRVAATRRVLLSLVALNVWTAIAVVGGRYAVGN